MKQVDLERKPIHYNTAKTANESVSEDSKAGLAERYVRCGLVTSNLVRPVVLGRHNELGQWKRRRAGRCDEDETAKRVSFLFGGRSICEERKAKPTL